MFGPLATKKQFWLSPSPARLGLTLCSIHRSIKSEVLLEVAVIFFFFFFFTLFATNSDAWVVNSASVECQTGRCVLAANKRQKVRRSVSLFPARGNKCQAASQQPLRCGYVTKEKCHWQINTCIRRWENVLMYFFIYYKIIIYSKTVRLVHTFAASPAV